MHDLATLRSGGYRNAGLTKLKLTDRLDAFPRQILDLGDSLEVLDLSGTGLSALPADFGSALPRLKVAFFSSCRFTRFPAALAACPRLEMVAFRSNGMAAVDELAFPPQLRWLILTDNRLTSVPASIGRCARLEKCMLAGNCLTGLPAAMAQCRNLTLLRLAANRLPSLPPWLLAMPKLAFLSFAGNPCSGAPPDGAAPSSLPHVDWDQIDIHHVLGQGASGVISQGTIRSSRSSTAPSSAAASRGPSGLSTPAPSGTSTPALSVSGASLVSTAASSLSASPPPVLPDTPVAVKIFRGALTSDGTPYDEMAACLAAGEHLNLVKVHGQIRWAADTDEAAEPFRGGLIMELIPPQYRVLGQPPSFESCTRDCFGADAAAQPLPVTGALAILRGVAAAAAHLHRRGIAHGDLYAHNILVSGTGPGDDDDDDAAHAILSDFGAATLYGGSSATGAEDGGAWLSNLERLEVLAFAHLVDDVLGLMAAAPEASAVRDELRRLHAQCAVPTVADRPTFAALASALAALQSSSLPSGA